MELEKKESVTPAIRLSRNHQFLILCLFPCYFFIVGFFASPPDEIIEGIITILREPDFLITDYIQLGGIGAAFINASLLTLTSIAILYCLITTTGLAGGLFWPYKGPLPALESKDSSKGSPAATSFT